MIETKIIKLEADEFVIGKIFRCTGKDCLYLFDIIRMEMLRLSLSSSPKILTRIMLKDFFSIRQVDSVFIDETVGNLVIADSIAKKFHMVRIGWKKEGIASLSKAKDYPLKSGSIIVAAAVVGEEYFLLDKGNSMIRILNRDFGEVSTLGSRMGYVREYEDENRQRLGFEFPEDMAVSVDGKRIVVSDSGNKRLVLISLEGSPTPRWEMKKSIFLPEFPYKIICWNEYESDDRLIISDFDCGLMIVSLRHGFIGYEETGQKLNFYPHQSHHNMNNRRAYLCTETNELVEMVLPDIPLDAAAEAAGNYPVLMKYRMDQGKLKEARQLVKDHPELLPEYMMNSGSEDPYFNDSLIDYVNETFRDVLEENKSIRDEVLALSHRFMITTKSIPDSEDVESANIDKENLRHKMFLKLKRFRNRLNELKGLKQVVKHSSAAKTALTSLLDDRFDTLTDQVDSRLEDIETHLTAYAELELLNAIVNFWILMEEEDVLFRDRGFKYEKPFGSQFLLATINDFYYNVAELYLKRKKIDEYISFADREITMFPDKISIFNRFNDQLIKLQKYDDVLRMLEKFPDKNKENVNYLYYQVYMGKREKEKAFLHLKKELELYPHRTHLVPLLIGMERLTSAEAEGYINRILEKAGNAIDVYFNAARSFNSIGDFRAAENHVNRELALFPENKNALFLKFKLFCRHPLHSMSPGYYRQCWEIFKAFIRFNRDESIASTVISFFSVLNHVTLSTEELVGLSRLTGETTIETYKKELSAYISFINDVSPGTKMAGAKRDIEPGGLETYLSAYSTSKLAYDFLLGELDHRSKDKPGEWGKTLELAEVILKYNPGDEKIFQILER